MTIKAIMGFIDDEPAGIIGIAREQWAARFFSEFKPELEPYLNSVIIMRGIRLAMRFVREYPTYVFAVAEHDEGCRLLERLGFVPTGRENGFVWVN